MRIVYIGTVEFSKKALEKLISLKADIVGVLTKRKSSFNHDFADLSDICRKNDIPCEYVKDINLAENVKRIKELKPDIIFCFGFSQLLKEEILNIAPMGILGFHPAKLPQNRGRHPVTWALVLGLDKTASTFFFLKEGTDDGDILSQKEIQINYEDNARTLYDKVVAVALEQIEEFLFKLQNKEFHTVPQEHSQANYWRKRGREDGKIDFRMTSTAIYNLVRGLTRPYVGSHIIYEGRQIKIWAVEEVKLDLNNIEYGKVLDVKGNRVLVRCGHNAILLTEHEFDKLPEAGEYLR